MRSLLTWGCLGLLAGLMPLEAQYVRDMPYFHQYSNRLNPSGSCQNTCVAMVLKHYGAEDITPDRITARWGTGVAKTVVGLKQVLNTEAEERGLTVRDNPLTDGKLADVHRLLDAGRPVIVHGRFSTSGHLLVLVGYDENHYFVHDPAGQWRQRLDAGFTNTGDADIGRYTRYERQALEAAIISADHHRRIAMHEIYFVEGALGAVWQDASDRIAVAGQTLQLDEIIETSAASSATADLRAIGGAQEHPLMALGEGRFSLAVDLPAPPSNGRYRLEVQLEGEPGRQRLHKYIEVIPAADAVLFEDEIGPGWRQGVLISAALGDGQAKVASGEQSLALDARAFTFELLPQQPLAASGFEALRFLYHRGQVEYGARPAFTVQLNNDPRKTVALFDGQWAGVAIDPGQGGWQVVEIPLAAFYPLEEPLTSLRLFGNLRGTFYLDDIRLTRRAVEPGATAVVERRDDALPDDFSLGQNYPNPFNSSTVIPFSVTEPGPVRLALFNLAGQHLVDLVSGRRAPGRYRVHWDGRDAQGRPLASGLYLYRLQTAQSSTARKLTLLH